MPTCLLTRLPPCRLTRLAPPLARCHLPRLLHRRLAVPPLRPLPRPLPRRWPLGHCRQPGQGWSLAQGRDQPPHPGDDVTVEILRRGLPPLDVLQPLLPLRGQFRAAQGFGHPPDEGLALGGGPQLLALALHVAGADELLDDLGPRRWRTQARLLHGGGEGIVLDLPPGVLHGRQQAGVVIGTGGLGLLLHHLQTADLDDLTDGEGRQGTLPVCRLLRTGGGWRLAVLDCHLAIASGLLVQGLTDLHSQGLPRRPRCCLPVSPLISLPVSPSGRFPVRLPRDVPRGLPRALCRGLTGGWAQRLALGRRSSRPGNALA